jgi:fibronectin type 3 domain-containing protein
MKRILLILAILAMASSAFAATLNFTVQWDANTEPDMKEYRLYRTDGARQQLGVIPHPTTTYDFAVTVPENASGKLVFVLTAVDTSLNESLDSLPVEWYWTTIDTTAPGAPKTIIIIIKTGQ